MLLYERLCALCPDVALRRDVQLSPYTTLRVGGPADVFAEPENEDQLRTLLAAARAEDAPVLLLGNGSNLLVRDGGFRGLAIHLGKSFSSLQIRGGEIDAQAGLLMSALARAARDGGLTGLEFAQGIPGSVGGGIYMNAGAYGGEIASCVSSVRVLDGTEIREISGADMRFSYRHSRAMEENWIILGARLRLAPGEIESIDGAMRDYAARRKEKQPLEYPSAGSFFKRPADYFAGKLIQDAGLKGAAVGGAQVSEKHAGFLINRGGATAADFLRLKDLVQETVLERFGVRLEPEVRIVGSDA